jgi:acetyl-CoA synthetase
MSNTQSKTYPPSADMVANTHVDTAKYDTMYAASIADPNAFWGEHGKRIDWIKPYTQVKDVNFDLGNVSINWYADGTLNVAANCIDRHLATRGDQTAIIWEPDSPTDEALHITYKQLHVSVSKMANVLKDLGVTKGDRVVIYMPMIPEAAYAMLACARIGAPHSVVFAGFSAEALGSRIVDGNSNWVVTADGGMRGGRIVKLKSITDQAIANIPESAGGPSLVKNVFCFKRTNENVNFVEGRDLWMEELCANAREKCLNGTTP